MLNIDPNPNPEDDQGEGGDTDLLHADNVPADNVPHTNNLPRTDNVPRTDSNTAPAPAAAAAVVPSSTLPPMLPASGADLGSDPAVLGGGGVVMMEGGVGLEQQATMFSNMIARQMMAMQQQQMQVMTIGMKGTVWSVITSNLSSPAFVKCVSFPRCYGVHRLTC